MDHSARRAGLEPAQHQLLLAVKAHAGEPTVGDLAERLQLQHHSVVGLIDRLVDVLREESSDIVHVMHPMRLPQAFEAAERSNDPERRKKLLVHFKTPRPRAKELFWLKRLEIHPLVATLALVAIIAVAAALLIVGSFEIGDSSAFVAPQLRSQQAQPGIAVPPEMMVVVAEDGKLFHAGHRLISLVEPPTSLRARVFMDCCT